MCRYTTKNSDFENSKIAYNCIYIVNFRKLGIFGFSDFPKIYNVNAVISDFSIFRNHYFGWCFCTFGNFLTRSFARLTSGFFLRTRRSKDSKKNALPVHASRLGKKSHPVLKKMHAKDFYRNRSSYTHRHCASDNLVSALVSLGKDSS